MSEKEQIRELRRIREEHSANGVSVRRVDKNGRAEVWVWHRENNRRHFAAYIPGYAG